MDRLDAKLLELIRQKPAEKLSAVEVASLAERLVNSDAVREALVDKPEYEPYLEIVLGRAGLSAGDLKRRASKAKRRRHPRAFPNRTRRKVDSVLHDSARPLARPLRSSSQRVPFAEDGEAVCSR